LIKSTVIKLKSWKDGRNILSYQLSYYNGDIFVISNLGLKFDTVLVGT